MGADKSNESTNIYLPKLSVQAQKFGISMKKGFIRRPSTQKYPTCLDLKIKFYIETPYIFQAEANLGKS